MAGRQTHQKAKSRRFRPKSGGFFYLFQRKDQIWCRSR
jgi:hypothetical protein